MEQFKLSELYEVFRVESDVALFFEDHLKRLMKGAEISGIDIHVNKKELVSYINNFLVSTNKTEGNVRLSFYFDPEKKSTKHYKAQFVSTNYPDTSLYHQGISCLLLSSERLNPETKIANDKLRNEANEMIQEHHVYETLLVNRHKKITEGSRSNVFFIQDNILITAPDKKVLPGVVRKKVLNLARIMGITIDFRCIEALQEIETIDAAFITGTSSRILPIKRIENINFDPNHPITRELIDRFDKLVNEYIANQVTKNKNRPI
jgi:branched-chain amino acid aminotransferase